MHERIDFNDAFVAGKSLFERRLHCYLLLIKMPQILAPLENMNARTACLS